MDKNRNLKISFWNANSVLPKKDELTIFLEEHKIDIMLLSETFLKKTKDMKIRNYNIYRTDRRDGSKGGTAILIKNGIEHGELPKIEETNIESTGIRIEIEGRPTNIYSIYKSPLKEMKEEDIKKIFKSKVPTIAAGDINAKHTDWNCRVSNTSGRILSEIIEKHNIILAAPNEHTHISSNAGTTDILDIALMKNIRWNYEIESRMDLSSDHCPVIMELETTIDRENTTRKITNWRSFRENIEAKNMEINDHQQLEEAIFDLERRIKTAEEKSTKSIIINTKNEIPQHIKTLLAEKKIAKKKYIRTMHPEDKKKLNSLTNEIKSELREHSNEKWKEKMEALQTEDKSLWQMTKAITGKNKKRNIPFIKLGTEKAIIDAEKVETFAKMLEEQFKLNEGNKDYEFNSNIDRIGRKREDQENNEKQIEEITQEEVQENIKALKTRKAPGRDGVTNNSLKNLPTEIVKEIANIGNAVIKLEYYPKIWKKSETIMIHKNGKPVNEASSYRPINLLSAISKLIEKSIYKRLKEHVEEHGIIPKHQFGFRTEHTTTYQLARITEDIKEKLNVSTPTGAIFLDIEKAFDRVWHQGLIYKMKEKQFPRKITNIIMSYLEDRKYEVKIGNKKSKERKIEAGVPQASVLGPLLFNIYTSDTPKLKNCKIAQFADDTAIYISNRNRIRTHRGLQEDMEILEKYYRKWKIKINPTKTVGVYFDHKRRKCTKLPEMIEVEEQQIKWQKEAKYLGVILDEHLNFNRQIEENRKRPECYRDNYTPCCTAKVIYQWRIKN
ncbi:hypothetical protein WA026_018088 [Henosepilachna vigintioctopunctata]|uniref:Reverse transcriptase domain-containing protein n=1 Tax=Henosepilachna vigintioctopunctata TaxID=420089 RepID=A0AAW1UE08_9CUCU